jgi:hypothetical protein
MPSRSSKGASCCRAPSRRRLVVETIWTCVRLRAPAASTGSAPRLTSPARAAPSQMAARVKAMQEAMQRPEMQQQMQQMMAMAQNTQLQQRMQQLKNDPEMKSYFEEIEKVRGEKGPQGVGVACRSDGRAGGGGWMPLPALVRKVGLWGCRGGGAAACAAAAGPAQRLGAGRAQGGGLWRWAEGASGAAGLLGLGPGLLVPAAGPAGWWTAQALVHRPARCRTAAPTPRSWRCAPGAALLALRSWRCAPGTALLALRSWHCAPGAATARLHAAAPPAGPPRAAAGAAGFNPAPAPPAHHRRAACRRS